MSWLLMILQSLLLQYRSSLFVDFYQLQGKRQVETGQRMVAVEGNFVALFLDDPHYLIHGFVPEIYFVNIVPIIIK